MTELPNKPQKYYFFGALILLLLGLGFVWMSKTLSLNKEQFNKNATSLLSPNLVEVVDLYAHEDKHLTPFSRDWARLWAKGVNDSARDIFIRTPNEDYIIHSNERIPANLLDALGIVLFPRDKVLLNGIQIDPNLPFEEGVMFLQFVPARKISLVIDDDKFDLFTDQPTLGAALENEKILVSPQDWISRNMLTPVEDNMIVVIHRAKPVTVRIGENLIIGLTAAKTVNDALSDLDITPQNLDRIIPDEDEPLPENREIRLVQVSEQVLIITDETPYQNEYVEDPNAELDTISVVEAGQIGIFATRERIQFSDGKETWRDTQETWQASEAEDGVLGYGSQVVTRTAIVDGQEIEYWRKISVYANSYSPCRIGVPGKCGYGTASGLPMGNGIIAVTPNWFNMMKFQRVFVQGYGHGTIADVGGGANYFNHFWIDLGYTDDTYQSWHHWTTMYFLTPVPAWYPTVLPWP